MDVGIVYGQDVNLDAWLGGRDVDQVVYLSCHDVHRYVDTSEDDFVQNGR